MHSEADLVQKLKEKDAAAFSLLYDSYAPALYGMVLRLTPDEEVATKILEKSFLNFWQQMQSFDTANGKLFPWMVRITISDCTDILHLPKAALLQSSGVKAAFSPSVQDR